MNDGDSPSVTERISHRLCIGSVYIYFICGNGKKKVFSKKSGIVYDQRSCFREKDQLLFFTLSLISINLEWSRFSRFSSLCAI